jgi:hypothetical protein
MPARHGCNECLQFLLAMNKMSDCLPTMLACLHCIPAMAAFNAKCLNAMLANPAMFAMPAKSICNAFCTCLRCLPDMPAMSECNACHDYNACQPLLKCLPEKMTAFTVMFAMPAMNAMTACHAYNP